MILRPNCRMGLPGASILDTIRVLELRVILLDAIQRASPSGKASAFQADIRGSESHRPLWPASHQPIAIRFQQITFNF
jgi:hypothetical protein